MTPRLAAISVLLVIAWASGAFARAEEVPAGYIRVEEREETGGVALQIAMKRMDRGPTGPSITLVGVAHVGDASYYAELQGRLDAHDLVLFEGVGPMWASLRDDAPASDRIPATRARMRTLAVAIQSRERQGVATPTLDDLVTGAGGYEARLLRKATRDGWGRPMRYQPDGGGRMLLSLGADGTPGGTGPDADIALADLPPILESELKETDGIQARLARAAGLEFQLDAIDYDRPNWRNSDTTGEALAAALAGRDPSRARPSDGTPGPGGGEVLLETLQGRGFAGRVAGGLLRMLGSNPRSSAFLRLMLIETLGRADELMAATGAIEGVERMMHVLLEQRNAVVLGDIRSLIEHEDRAGAPDTIAVFYGAAHLADIEGALRELGFRVTSTEWLDAMVFDPDAAGMSREQARAARSMLSNMLEAQASMLARPAAGDRE